MLKEACKHQSVSLASEIKWLRVWEAARDEGPAAVLDKDLTSISCLLSLSSEREIATSVTLPFQFLSHLTLQNHAPQLY